jgi:hypothetical protein
MHTATSGREGDAVFKYQLTLAAAALLLASGTHAQVTDDFATGNMHFDARAMHANCDGMMSKDEFMKYAEQKCESSQAAASGV